MNKIKRYFVYDKESWTDIKKKGLKHYLLSVGLLKIGLIGGLVCLTFYYLNHLSFKFGEFTLNEFFFGYLVWLPICLIIGVLLAGFSWMEYNRKFSQ